MTKLFEPLTYVFTRIVIKLGQYNGHFEACV